MKDLLVALGRIGAYGLGAVVGYKLFGGFYMEACNEMMEEDSMS